jgi:hypothetical protein
VEGEVIAVLTDPIYDETRRSWRVPALPPPPRKARQLPKVPFPVALIVIIGAAVFLARVIPVKAAAPPEKIEADAPRPPATVCTAPAASAAPAAPIAPVAIASVAKMPEPTPPASTSRGATKARPMKRLPHGRH